MTQFYPAAQRGRTDFGWLQSWHGFSFGRFIDRSRMGFASMRVLNDDIVAPGKGFDTHPHDNMEIVTIVLSGALQHRDSMGNASVIRPGDIQRMSAGSGLQHSEQNASDVEPVHLLQLWFFPQQRNVTPSYAQKHFDNAEKHGRFRLLASQDGRDDAITLGQDVDIAMAHLDGDQSTAYPVRAGRQVWVQMARGSAQINGQMMQAGDALAVSDAGILQFDHGSGAEILLLDMAPYTFDAD